MRKGIADVAELNGRGFTLTRIARLLDMPKSTVHTYLRRGANEVQTREIEDNITPL